MENLSSDETVQNDAIRGCPDRACHRLDEFSPVYPWQVALQQSLLPFRPVLKDNSNAVYRQRYQLYQTANVPVFRDVKQPNKP